MQVLEVVLPGTQDFNAFFELHAKVLRMFAPYAQKKIIGRPRPEDPDDVRLGAAVSCWEGPLESCLEKVKAGDFVVMGYVDDRGVERNGGRTGAFEAPDEIRKLLYSMTLAVENPKELPLKIWDIGNLKSWGDSLHKAHENARMVIAKIREKGGKILSLGGGHDWAYADFVDFSKTGGKKAQLVNIDAHLDMRPLPENEDKAWHSGTPFRRILSEENPPRFTAIGLQKHCNAQAHINWAHGVRAATVFLEDMSLNLSDQVEFLSKKLDLDSDGKHPFGLSIDLDAFPQSAAPGVSAPQAIGVDPMIAISLIQKMGKNLQQLGLYEMNPRYDLDGRTARLAAKLAHTFLVSTI